MRFNNWYDAVAFLRAPRRIPQKSHRSKVVGYYFAGAAGAAAGAGEGEAAGAEAALPAVEGAGAGGAAAAACGWAFGLIQQA
jgi:hypothetical protein